MPGLEEVHEDDTYESPVGDIADEGVALDEAMDAAAAIGESEAEEAEAADEQEGLEAADDDTPDDAEAEAEEEPEPKADEPLTIELDGGVTLIQDGEGIRVEGLKVDGRIETVPADELVRGYQRGKAATQRFQEAAKLEKTAKAVLGEIQSADPRRVGHILKQIGVDFDQLAEQHLEAKLRELEMSPAERARLEVQRERQELDRERQEWQRSQQNAEIDRAAQQYQTQWANELAQAAERAGHAGDQRVMNAAIQAKERALGLGYDLPWVDAVAEVTANLGPAAPSPAALPDDPEALIAALGEEKVKALLAHRAAKVRSPQRQRKAAPATRSRKAPVRVNMRDEDAVRALLDGKL